MGGLSRLTRGQLDEWAANDPDFAAMIGWSDAPLPFGDEFSQIWSLGYAHGTLYAGTKPASLLARAMTAERPGSISRGLPTIPPPKAGIPAPPVSCCIRSSSDPG
jgi:hypothetical protein